jgi:hypothetical protein
LILGWRLALPHIQENLGLGWFVWADLSSELLTRCSEKQVVVFENSMLNRTLEPKRGK